MMIKINDPLQEISKYKENQPEGNGVSGYIKGSSVAPTAN